MAQNLISGSEFNKDLDYLTDKLEKYYSGIYYYDYPENLLAKKKDLYKSEGDTLDILEAYHFMADYITHHRDLHLSVGLPKRYFDKNQGVFPLFLRKFNDQFYLSYNGSEDSTLVRGHQIVSINGVSPIEDFKNFKTLYAADNNNPVSKDYYASASFGNYYQRWYGPTDSIEVVYKKPQQAKKDTTILKFPSEKAVLDTLKKRYEKPLRKNFEYKVIDSTLHLSKLDITSFVSSKGIFSFNDRKFKRQLKQRFEKINNDSTEHLILDLRGNGGGAVVNVKRLLNYLSDEPFQLFDTLSISNHNFNKIFKPYFILPYFAGRLFYTGKTENGYYKTYSTRKTVKKTPYRYHKNLYVLMDGGSYSATTFTISLLNNMERATFIGTQPGGADWGSFAGVFYFIKLPNSKIRVRIPQMKLTHSTKGKSSETFFVQPDYYVNQNFEDFMEMKDSYVEFVKDIIK